MALCPGLLRTASPQNPHLCEGYAGADGHYHPGFCCPRLTDPPGHHYCCRPDPRALKSCCSCLGAEALAGVNLSALAGLALLRNPLALPFVGLYGLVVLLLMALDLAHFCWTRHCRLARLLPRRPPGGRRPRSRLPRALGGLPPAPGWAC
ncbi:protein shisa-like-1a [Pterocles gutturalis]